MWKLEVIASQSSEFVDALSRNMLWKENLKGDREGEGHE